jgi:hypothetical protein
VRDFHGAFTIVRTSPGGGPYVPAVVSESGNRRRPGLAPVLAFNLIVLDVEMVDVSTVGLSGH